MAVFADHEWRCHTADGVLVDYKGIIRTRDISSVLDLLMFSDLSSLPSLVGVVGLLMWHCDHVARNNVRTLVDISEGRQMDAAVCYTWIRALVMFPKIYPQYDRKVRIAHRLVELCMTSGRLAVLDIPFEYRYLMQPFLHNLFQRMWARVQTLSYGTARLPAPSLFLFFVGKDSSLCDELRWRIVRRACGVL